ncbi:MAG: cupredoxin domain-containing protein [Acidimicrobiales bacterium]
MSAAPRPGRLRLPVLASLAATLLLAGGALPARGASGPVAKVSMKDFSFLPATMTIKAGTAVTWTYDEVATDPMGCEAPQFQTGAPGASCPGHSTTSADNGPNGKPLWDSGVHRAGGFPFSLKFSTPGTYHYYCTVHGGSHPNNPLTHMDGIIVVQATAPQSGSADVGGAGAQEGGAGGTQTPVATRPAADLSASEPVLPRTGGPPDPRWALVLVLAGMALGAARRLLHD